MLEIIKVAILETKEAILEIKEAILEVKATQAAVTL